MIFEFNIEPVAWQRVQRNRFGTTFVPAKTRQFKAAIQVIAKYKMGFKEPTSNPVIVDIHFQLTRPKKPSNTFPRQDIDNLTKGILDAFNGVVYLDDKQVVELKVRKDYANSGHIVVRVNEQLPLDL